MKPKNDYNDFKEIVKRAITEIEEESKKDGQQKHVDNNFEITHKEFVARAFESGGDVYGKVKAHIIRNTRLDCSLYRNSINKTSEETGVSRSTVRRIFDSLQKDDIMRKYAEGVWAINPKFLRRGTGGKYIGLIKLYYSLPMKTDKEA